MPNTQAQQNKVNITLPDGTVREYDAPTTGEIIAGSIGEGLLKAALAITVNGEDWDLNREITEDASVAIITARDEAGLDIIRHDTAHILAQAVQEIYPETQVTIGPNITDGFYYDFARDDPFTLDDLEKFEKRMEEIVVRNDAIQREEWNRDDAIKFFEKKGEKYKAEIIRDLPESETITLYRQGEFIDLCRGPHASSTGKPKAFKLMKLAGAYWRGDNNNQMLQRVYGTAWPDKKQLKQYLHRLEEAEKRDHRKLGREMDLFHFEDSAPGQPFWHDKGWLVYTQLIDYMREKIRSHGYTEVNTPQVLDINFWKYSGHWDKYRENMFVVDETSDMPFALKPMSCPGNVQIFKQGIVSYRDLPLRMAEFGKVFRHEAHGARHGLMRVQGFTQDDAHIFCTSDQLEDEIVKMCDLIQEVYTELGFSDIRVMFSTRPEQRIGNDEDWDRAEEALQKVCDRMGFEWELNEGDGAFYAPKLDFVLRDAIGRQWQCGTIQVDMNLPERLDISYIGEDGNKHRPHMVHRAIMGSIERFMGIMIEHYAGKFPLWLAPLQVVVATVITDANDYAEQIVNQLKEKGIRAEADLRNEKISYKVREHSHAKVPVIFAVGAREVDEQTVSVRRIGSNQQIMLALDEAVKILLEEVENRTITVEGDAQ